MIPPISGMAGDPRADDRARTRQDVERLRRDARLPEDLVDHQPGQHALVSRLEDEAVAGEQGRGDGVRRKGEREVERADEPPHAVGPQHLHEGAGAVAGEPVAEPLVLLHLLAVQPEQPDQLVDLAEGLEPALRGLEDRDGRELAAPGLHDVGGPPDDADALPPIGPAPRRREPLRRRDRVVHVVGRGLGETTDHQVTVDG